MSSMHIPERLRGFEWHDLPVDEIAICSAKLVVTVTPYAEESGEYRTFLLVLEEPEQVTMAVAGTLAAADLKNIELASLDVTEAEGDVLSGAITFLPGSAGVWTIGFRGARWSLAENTSDGHRAERADTIEPPPGVWIFNGNNSPFPSAVFLSLAAAEAWIQLHGLSGTLTEYPVGVSAYDWAVQAGHFQPTKERHRSAQFVASFSSGVQRHFHYDNGLRG